MANPQNLANKNRSVILKRLVKDYPKLPFRQLRQMARTEVEMEGLAQVLDVLQEGAYSGRKIGVKERQAILNKLISSGLLKDNRAEELAYRRGIREGTTLFIGIILTALLPHLDEEVLAPALQMAKRMIEASTLKRFGFLTGEADWLENRALPPPAIMELDAEGNVTERIVNAEPQEGASPI